MVDFSNFPGASSADVLKNINLLSNVKMIVNKTNKTSNTVLTFSKIIFRKDNRN